MRTGSRPLRKVGGTEAPRSGDDLIAFTVGPNGDGLDESLGTKTFGELGQLGFIEDAAGVGGGLVDVVRARVWNPALCFLVVMVVAPVLVLGRRHFNQMPNATWRRRGVATAS